MAIIKDPPPWSEDDARELVRVLGHDREALLRDLAWVRFRHEGFAAAWTRYMTPAVMQQIEAHAARVAADRRQLAVMAAALRKATTAHQALSWRCREELDAALGVNLDRLVDPLQAWLPRPQRARGRGRPPSEPRQVALDVGLALRAHGIRLTMAPGGRFAAVLAVVLRTLDLDADVDGLVRAITSALR